MMRQTHFRREPAISGFTLLELTMAMAIFTIAVAVAAKCLVSYYATMDAQNQRVIALHECRTVLNQMRSCRAANPNTAALPNKCATALLAQFPPNTNTAGPAQLKNSTVKLTYESTAVTANPLVPTVTVTWKDMRGHAMSTSLSTALSDQ